MPSPICFETLESQKIRQEYAGGTLVGEWVVWYVDEVSTAIELVQATAPNPFTTSHFGNLSIKRIEGRNLGAPDLWLFNVYYGSYATGGDLRPDQWSFRVVGNSTHITSSIETQSEILATDTVAFGVNLTVDNTTDTDVAPDAPDTYTPVMADVGKNLVIYGGLGFTPEVYLITGLPAGQWSLDASPAPVSTAGGFWFLAGTGTDFKNAIGVTQDTVQGCEIIIPASEFSYVQNYVTLGDDDYRLFRSIVGTINNQPFRGYPTGTLLYLGFEPTSSEGNLVTNQPFMPWALTHRFKYEPDVVNFTIGAITVAVKPGHSYLWARYMPKATVNVLTVPPVQVNIERVYPYGDFTVLGITL